MNYKRGDNLMILTNNTGHIYKPGTIVKVLEMGLNYSQIMNKIAVKHIF